MTAYASKDEHYLFAEWRDCAPDDFPPPITIRDERETNRILAEFRGRYREHEYGDDQALRRRCVHYLTYLDGDVYDWRYLPEEMFEHARRVLTRLARALDRAPDGYYYTVVVENPHTGDDIETNTWFDYGEDAADFAEECCGSVELRYAWSINMTTRGENNAP